MVIPNLHTKHFIPTFTTKSVPTRRRTSLHVPRSLFANSLDFDGAILSLVRLMHLPPALPLLLNYYCSFSTGAVWLATLFTITLQIYDDIFISPNF